MQDDTRVGGYSESLNKNEAVQKFLHTHLEQACLDKDFSNIEMDFYRFLDPIDYESLKAFIQQKDRDLGQGADESERF